jgi:formylmethanofuran dehydrogenase subunit E
MTKKTATRDELLQEIRDLKKIIKQKEQIIELAIAEGSDWLVEEIVDLEMNQRGMKSCNECGEETPRKNKKCVSCGRPVATPDYRWA